MKKPTREQVREVVGFIAGTAASAFVSAAGGLISSAVPVKGLTKIGIKAGAVVLGIFIGNKVDEHFQERFDEIAELLDEAKEVLKKCK